MRGVCRHGVFVVEQFGDAEIEQVRFTFGVDQNIAGFDVAVDDKLGVGVGDGVDDFGEELNNRFGFKLFGSNVVVDRLADHVFKRDVRLRIRINTCVVEPRNAGMFKARENVALASEAGGEQPVQVFDQRHFERDLPLVCAVRTCGEPHHAHAATTDFFDQAIRAYVLTGFAGGRR